MLCLFASSCSLRSYLYTLVPGRNVMKYDIIRAWQLRKLVSFPGSSCIVLLLYFLDVAIVCVPLYSGSGAINPQAS